MAMTAYSLLNKTVKLTCNLWLSPTINGRWFTPRKNTHSRQLAMQTRFAAVITWTRSQCSILTACKRHQKDMHTIIFHPEKPITHELMIK
jgi:hypothetical protein